MNDEMYPITGEEVVRRSISEIFDWNTLFIGLLLVISGLLSIYSATFDAGMQTYFNKQLMFTGIGMVFLIGFTFASERLIAIITPYAYFFGLILLIAVIAIGKTVYGSKSWLIIGPISLQPSEIAKFTTLLAVARYVARPNVDLRTLRDSGIMASIILFPVILIMMEPDFGSGTVYLAMGMGILLWCGGDILWLFCMVVPPIVALLSFLGTTWQLIAMGVATLLAVFAFRGRWIGMLVAIGLSVGAGFSTPIVYKTLKPHQKSRIDVFLDPAKDPRGKGYNVLQAQMAVGSGGFFGKGFLQGTQTQLRYIPKQWTDFIYCVPTEEFGFIGGIGVLGLLLGLCYRSVMIAQSVRTRFTSALAAGIGAIWLYHTTINIGMAIGITPVMGIPLPFLSAGGSSLVVNMSMLGLLLNFFRNRKKRSM